MSFTPKLSSNGLKWLFIFFIFGSFPLAGQKAQIEFFQTNEHLSSFDPQKIMQDKDGFLWVMGQSVDRYDGYNFVNIKEQEKGWEDFELDKQHYISSEDEIIYRSEDHFISRQVKTGKADSIYFRDLLLEGEIINEDFFFHETTSDQRYFFFYEPSTKKTTFLEWKEGRLNRKFFRTDIGTVGDLDFPSLISDTHGNFFYRNKTKTHFIKIDSEGNLLQKIPSPVSSSYIRFLKRGVNNTIYAVYPNEIFQLKEHADSFELHPINQYLSSKSSFKFIMDFLELPNEDLWVCGDDRKLFLYKHATGKVYDYRKELSQLIPIRASLLELISDQTGILWIRIQQFGILKVIPQQSLFDTYVTEPECDGFCSFRGMVENESGQIFASFYDGVFQLDPTNKTSTKLFPHIVNYFPFGLGYNDGHLLLNSGQRLNSYTGEMDENIPMIPGYRTDEGAMAEDDSGNWWNGQGQNVWFFDTKSKNKKWKKKIQVPGENAKITCLHFGEKSKRIWIANRHQLFYIDVHNNIITKYVEMHGKEIIHAIYEDKRKNIWLGTENGFVVVEPHNKILKKYKTQDGLPHDFVSGILSEGDSCLWLGTNSGLSRFQIEKEIFTNFYTEHGLSHNEFNRISTFKAKDGQLFFGGIRGINAFYPHELMQKYQKQQNIGKVMLSAVSHIDEKLDTTLRENLNLDKNRLEYFHWDKSITFEFCLTDYSKSTKNQFSYLLEGYDQAWSTPSKYNFAKYNSLPPGDYVFRVKAFDAKGYWNPNELHVPIKVYPPWWQTTWAYLVYGLILCGIFYGVYHVLRYRIELENQFKFEQKEAQRLKELDSFKSRLFTNLTHEFRTPLTVILGMAKQVSKGTQRLNLDEKLKNTLLSQTNLIEQNGQSLLVLVNQLLDLSKLENDAFKINLQHSDVLPFLSYSVSSFQSFANQQNLALKFSSPLDTLNMDFDPALLQQVIINLISNAIKFTESGGNISVKVNQIQQGENNFLNIEIQDTGIGIPSEKLPNIFDRFYQVDGSTTRAGEGTGIGLAHTKELIQLMKGEILVQSTLGQGTTFSVNIPVKNNLENIEIESKLEFSENTLEPYHFDLNEKRINKTSANVQSSDLPKLLIIEDNPDVVIYLKTCLDSHYQIDVAYNGKIGIEKALQNIPDLIISDIMMPEKDGFEVCDLLKNDERTSHIPIILLTAKADVTSKINGLKRGADAYLAKPFDQEELEVRLQSLLERQQRLVRYFSNKYTGLSLSNNGEKSTKSLEKPSTLFTESLQIEHAFIQKIEAILEKNYADKDFSLNHLCQKIGMSRSQLFRKTKALINTSPSHFIKSFRLKKAKHLLETTDLNVSEVAWATGFSSLPHFSRVFQEEFGISPSTTSNSL